jgi:hypothetical protein
MAFRLRIVLKDGRTIVSGKIAPDSPGTSFNDIKVAHKIEKYGRAMTKTSQDVVSCEQEYLHDET